MILESYRKYLRDYRRYFILLVLLFLSCVNTGGKSSYKVLKVTDGDTIVINHPKVKKVRYLGIDAPEKLSVRSPGEPFHLRSTDLNRKLVEGRSVTVEFDQEKQDHYGRLLGYIFVDGTFVNEEIVRQGLARALFIGKNKRYKDRILKAQQEAKNARRGMWGDPQNFKTPAENRRFLIKPADVKNHINRSVVVRGNIKSVTKKNSKVIVMSMENSLNLVFFRSDLGSFRFFGINPADFYPEKRVEVIGRVKMYRGYPQITVKHPISIKVLD